MAHGFENNANSSTVLIWLNSEFFNHKGHVSIQTHRGGQHDRGVYASFWPISNNPLYARPEFVVRNGPQGIFRTKNYDYVRMGPPDHVVKLNGLNVNRMNAEFAKILEEERSFAIYASIFPLSKLYNIANCTQIIYRLLRAGGLSSELMRGFKHFVGSNLCVLSAYALGVMIPLKFLPFSPAYQESFSASLLIKLLIPCGLWGTGLCLSRSSGYKGSTVLPMISSVPGFSLSCIGAAISLLGFAPGKFLLEGKSDVVRAIMFIFIAPTLLQIMMLGAGINLTSIPVMLAMNSVPNRPIPEFIMDDPDKVYRLVSALPGAVVQQARAENTIASINPFRNFLSTIYRNKWPLLAVTSVAAVVPLAMKGFLHKIRYNLVLTEIELPLDALKITCRISREG